MKVLMNALRWIAKHWAISTAVFLVIAIGVTTLICWNAFGKEKPDYVPVYVTVTGLGEGRDMEKHELMVDSEASVAEIFSLDYPEIYEDFRQPLVANNTFRSFMGVTANSSKRFYVKIDGMHENALSQAYVNEGCIIEIDYR